MASRGRHLAYVHIYSLAHDPEKNYLWPKSAKATLYMQPLGRPWAGLTIPSCGHPVYSFRDLGFRVFCIKTTNVL